MTDAGGRSHCPRDTPVMCTRRYRAPGRVNLIGEHTDYAGGLVLPCAIDREITLVAEPDDVIRLTSDMTPDGVELSADGVGTAAGWGAYVAAVARELDALGRPPVGLAGRLSSTLSAAVGLSSSAALEVCCAAALCDVAEFAVTDMQLAELCQRAERRAVGVPCGVMDQAAIVLGRAGHALLLDCATLEHEHVPFPEDVAIVVIDSGERRELATSAYAERRREVERGLAGASDEVARRRLRHVHSENERVRLAVDALREAHLDELGPLFRAGHDSLRDDFEVTTPALDRLVDLSYEHGAIAARMTGGGFGGAMIALAAIEHAAELAGRVTRSFAAEHGNAVPQWGVMRPADGAGRVA
jgi:galactokinase